jgi:hypothetical protein
MTMPWPDWTDEEWTSHLAASTATAVKDFDPALHPRDDAGRFTDAGGSAGAGEGSGAGESMPTTTQISAAARDTLYQKERAVKDQETESGFCIDPATGAVKFEAHSQMSDTIVIDNKNLDKIRDSVFTHNHPKNRSLSVNDVLTTVTRKGLAVRAVTPEGTTYQLQRLGKSWPLLFSTEVRLMDQRFYKEVEREIQDGTRTREETLATYHDQLWAKVSQAFPKEIAYSRGHV